MNARKLTEDQVMEVIKLSRSGVKGVEIARQFGVSPQLISFVRRQGYKPVYRQPEERIVSDFIGWSDLADRYNLLHPEDQISPYAAMRAHESALNKLKAYFASRGLTKQDF